MILSGKRRDRKMGGKREREERGERKRDLNRLDLLIYYNDYTSARFITKQVVPM